MRASVSLRSSLLHYLQREKSDSPTDYLPQPGPQSEFLSCEADIALFGGAAGGGKSVALLLGPRKHRFNPRYGAVIFRRTFTQIDQEGGLWERGQEVYFDAEPKRGRMLFTFGNGAGARARFAHLQYEKDKYNYQGGEIAYLGFDELTHFSESQFFYLVSRMRSTSGVRPTLRATCNPDPDSWVRKLVDWWIGEDGYPILERSGVLRYFIRRGDDLIWGDTPDDLAKYEPEEGEVKSFTFIVSRLKDNPKLTEADPGYRGRLQLLPKIERERLLGDPERGGNWNVRAVKGTLFRRDYFEIIDDVPTLLRYLRIWDLAGTAPHPGNRDPDYTVGMKLGLTETGLLVILDCYYARVGSLEVETAFKTRALQDGSLQLVEQEGGQSGKAQITHLQRLVPGVEVRPFSLSGNKETEEGQRLRYGPTSAKAEAGLIKMLRGPWNDFVLAWLEALCVGVAHDDVPDTLAGGYNELLLGAKGQKRRRSRTR